MKDFRLAAVHLVDSHYCSDPAKFISVCLTSLTTMLQIALPHVNLLSKVDLVEKFGRLQFGLDYYTEVLDLEFLLETVKSKERMLIASQTIDKANGYVFGSGEER